jgi:hypothetical protein
LLYPDSEAFPLALAGCLYPLLNNSGGLTQALITQFLILDTRHLDVDADASSYELEVGLWYMGTMLGKQVKGFD